MSPIYLEGEGPVDDPQAAKRLAKLDRERHRVKPDDDAVADAADLDDPALQEAD